MTTIGAIAVIALSLTTFITSPAKKMAQLQIHQLGEIFTNALLYVHPDHLKKVLRALLNFLDKVLYFWYCNFQSHGRFSFLLGFGGSNPFKGKAPFFLPRFRIHTKNITLPMLSERLPDVRLIRS
jgi:hypothetical protein